MLDNKKRYEKITNRRNVIPEICKGRLDKIRNEIMRKESKVFSMNDRVSRCRKD
jgi:hypothetical protein